MAGVKKSRNTAHVQYILEPFEPAGKVHCRLFLFYVCSVLPVLPNPIYGHQNRVVNFLFLRQTLELTFTKSCGYCIPARFTTWLHLHLWDCLCESP